MSSGFVSESALEEKRRQRQEEWEKVRKPEDPVEVPEEEYDGRCLYDRLKEQRDKKQLEWDEAHKLKNLVRGLDDDEVGFLDLVDRTKMAEEQRIMKEEKEELEEYRKAVATLAEQSTEERLKVESKPAPSTSSRSTHQSSSIGVLSKSQQSKLIASVVKRKSTENSNETAKKHKISPNPVEVKSASKLQCIAVLPGIGCYDESSDTDESSNSNEDNSKQLQFDLCGRLITHNNDNQ